MTHQKTDHRNFTQRELGYLVSTDLGLRLTLLAFITAYRIFTSHPIEKVRFCSVKDNPLRG